ncbi:DUF3800 domain-containing protein [Aeromicrobium chenweiae]|uniref:DUF3800 domain-containing protein n=1 Tax=Aeromicrobium chenweiae TaxID=2079793 RepID=A0A2S0WHQ9_9ACTN|nr:DUF3800 domain-containing protein [Aeromicrobium chenweiae]TGN32079.1 DUF3800 domain-containing protein [Aeromicrobium chenweiae]
MSWQSRPVLLTYVDESHSKNVYYVCGLAVHHEAIRGLETGLAKVVRDAMWEFDGFSSKAELHGHPLFHGEGDWEGLKPRQRIAMYNRALQVIADHDVKIFLRGVMRKRLTERYGDRASDPHDVCLQHLLERVNDYARGTDQVALVIADELHEHDRRRRDLTDFKDYGTPGYLSSTLPRIVDTIHFAPSHHSRLIQAADLIAFLHHRIETAVDTDERAIRANQSLWARIAPKVEHQWTWTP